MATVEEVGIEDPVLAKVEDVKPVSTEDDRVGIETMDSVLEELLDDADGDGDPALV